MASAASRDRPGHPPRTFGNLRDHSPGSLDANDLNPPVPENEIVRRDFERAGSDIQLSFADFDRRRQARCAQRDRRFRSSAA